MLAGCKSWPPPFTAEWLRDVLHYNPDTGIFTWRVAMNTSCAKAGARAGGPTDDGYHRITIRDRRYRAHNLAWFYMTGTWPSDEVDHINLDGTDNRWDNLRAASRSLNTVNRRIQSNNTSGYRGVSRNRGKWRAVLSVNGEQHWIGSFGTAEEAYKAYLAKARAVFGEFLRTG